MFACFANIFPNHIVRFFLLGTLDSGGFGFGAAPASTSAAAGLER
jgi:hypothetical protein